MSILIIQGSDILKLYETYNTSRNLTDADLNELYKRKQIREKGGLALAYSSMLEPLPESDGDWKQTIKKYYERKKPILTAYDLAEADGSNEQTKTFLYRKKLKRKMIYKLIVYSPFYLLSIIWECISAALRPFIVHYGIGKRLLQCLSMFVLLVIGFGLAILYEAHVGTISDAAAEFKTVFPDFALIAIPLSGAIPGGLAIWGKGVREKTQIPWMIKSLKDDAICYEYGHDYRIRPSDSSSQTPVTKGGVREASGIIYFGETAIYSVGIPQAFQYTPRKYNLK